MYCVFLQILNIFAPTPRISTVFTLLDSKTCPHRWAWHTQTKTPRQNNHQFFSVFFCEFGNTSPMRISMLDCAQTRFPYAILCIQNHVPYLKYVLRLNRQNLYSVFSLFWANAEQKTYKRWCLQCFPSQSANTASICSVSKRVIHPFTNVLRLIWTQVPKQELNKDE